MVTRRSSPDYSMTLEELLDSFKQPTSEGDKNVCTYTANMNKGTYVDFWAIENGSNMYVDE